jgi:hypothetical protein
MCRAHARELSFLDSVSRDVQYGVCRSASRSNLKARLQSRSGVRVRLYIIKAVGSVSASLRAGLYGVRCRS